MGKPFNQVENGHSIYYYNDQKEEYDELVVLDIKFTHDFYDVKVIAKFMNLYDKRKASFEAYSKLSRNDMFFTEKEERDAEINKNKHRT